ncbi:MAG: GNAT family N-acetyltransferase [Rhodospirillales bacterium]|nr:GNAT family N-acetyltransferase [Rhodospirillales bacterium]
MSRKMEGLVPGMAMRPLTPEDADAAQFLVAEAGWNQTIDDWRLMIGNGDAIGLFADSAPESEALAATALMLPFEGRFAWISMVLVRKSRRRRGLATHLLRHCVETLLDRGITPVLDATEAGRQVYAPLGFHDLFTIDRLQIDDVAVIDSLTDGPAGLSLRRMEPQDLQWIIDWDRQKFGADRGFILRSLRDRLPDLALVAERNDGRITGFILGRDGRLATQVGPVVAENADTARALAEAALRQTNGPVFIDAACHQESFVSWLYAAGFTRQRGFMRMAHARSHPFENPENSFAIAGPELG